MTHSNTNPAVCSTLSMRTAISPWQWQPWTAVSSLLGLISKQKQNTTLQVQTCLNLLFVFHCQHCILQQKTCMEKRQRHLHGRQWQRAMDDVATLSTHTLPPYFYWIELVRAATSPFDPQAFYLHPILSSRVLHCFDR